MAIKKFIDRHQGLSEEDVKEMLIVIDENNLEDLIDKTIPESIRLRNELDLSPEMSEIRFLEHMRVLSNKNKNYRSYIGMGYYNTVLPSVIQRNVLENPNWYTAYTPYQAEISQGRLEALLNYQTMVCDLTAMPIANASLLDEATAAAEGMTMLFNNLSREKRKNGANKFFVSELCFSQTIDVLKTRSEPLGIELVIGDHRTLDVSESFFGAILQYPSKYGELHDYENLVDNFKKYNVGLVVAADLLSLSMLRPPGEWGADVVIGTTQRFGIPMGYGGPHAAYFATTKKYKRNIPGRIIGVTKDKDGNRALRMALQTREQHIKRERATSNICTAQVLLAVMASMYGVYHGSKGILSIAKQIHALSSKLAEGLIQLGYHQLNTDFFDTILIKIGNVSMDNIKTYAEDAKINFNYIDEKMLSISIDEKDDINNIVDILEVFAKSCNHTDYKNLIAEVLKGDYDKAYHRIPDKLFRKSEFMNDDVFNSYHSETEMMRYIKMLEKKDLSLTHSMISLGSCTMKLNPAASLLPLSWTELSNIHPFVPAHQARGYHIMFHELEEMLCEITGFDAVSLQPNSGAQGEYAGLMVIRAFHHSRGDHHRNVCIIPSSAHGTNPASAVMAGMKVVVTPCDDKGNINYDELKIKVKEHSENLSCLMITYPSTHGVFEEEIINITELIHNNGGQVYMDGANMNAQVGLTNPAIIGADVCHLNLHKTFAIPHGGGGPGMGPIGVVSHLKEFLPSNPVIPVGGSKSISAISAAPWGSALALTISYAYIKMLGSYGLKKSTEIAILSANYLKSKVSEDFDILYTSKNGMVAHEMIVDFRSYKDFGISVADIAKRLMDYGYHAPTVSFPVPGTMMIEPTESESKKELDRFCQCLKSIKQEINQIINNEVDLKDNVIKNAPHTMKSVVSSNWNRPYDREKAVFPLSFVEENKFWPSVGRVDEAYGDRNLICTCSPIELYSE
ncbi:MAG: glycine dehydrogenase (aminomethyl-transferring) [Flavobacteriales bacterium]|nr:glycine dehydrogenase (aminomethyl-transferring) [Flavobacteriales bacterium]